MPDTGTSVSPVASLTKDEAERITLRISLKLGALADSYESVRPLIRQAIEGDAATALGYTGLSEYVADRFGGTLARLGVETRREVVRELEAAGLSTRAIAPIVGVSNKTVHQDLQVLPEVTPDPQSDPEPASAPPKIVGLDGKKYTRPQPKVLNPDGQLAELRAEAPDLADRVDQGALDLYDACVALEARKTSNRADSFIFGTTIPKLYGIVHDPAAFLSIYDPAHNPNAKSAHMLFTPQALHGMADQLHKLAALMEETT